MSIKTIYNKLSKLDYAVTQGNVNRVVKNFVKDKKLILHGSRALNVQTTFPLQRATDDFDIYTRTVARAVAKKLEKKLDEARNGNYHYIKAAAHKGTHLLMDVGFDLKKGTKDDRSIADFTKIPRKKFKTIRKNDINYAHIDELEKSKVSALKYKKYAYRHKKDKVDLETIKLIKRKGGLFFT